MVPRLAVGLLVSIAALLAPFGCTKNAVTGESSLLFLSKDQEKQMGAEAAPQMTQQFGGPVPNQQLQDYISSVGHKLAAQTEQDFPSFPWEFTLVNSDVINAFALPGGKIFITRGLAAILQNEAELAGVLGHECGHVTARHANQQMSQSQLFGIGLGAVEAGVGLAGQGSTISQVGQYGVPALKVGTNVFLLRYSRKDESQADELGMRYMSRAGYNPKAQREVMEILQKATESAGRELEILSTHPYPETRIQQIDQLLASQYKDWQTNPKYGFYEKEYQDKCLSILKTLPPAPKPPDAAAGAGGAQGLQQTGKKKH